MALASHLFPDPATFPQLCAVNFPQTEDKLNVLPVGYTIPLTARVTCLGLSPLHGLSSRKAFPTDHLKGMNLILQSEIF